MGPYHLSFSLLLVGIHVSLSGWIPYIHTYIYIYIYIFFFSNKQMRDKLKGVQQKKGIYLVKGKEKK